MSDHRAAPLADWIGSTETADDPMPRFPATALGALLGRDAIADTLPLPWHWLYALRAPAPGATGHDGHPARGGFLPPIDLPRRMWASSEIALHHRLRLGTPARRRSTVTDIAAKTGRTGPLIFVTVTHDWMQDGALCLAERQTIVYREIAGSRADVVAPATGPIDDALVRETVTPDPVMLFRYSALTYNAHRIHFDTPYATEVEGYPGLVVHGPLIATLLIDAARDLFEGRSIARFSFRAERPAFVGAPLHLCASAADDRITMWSLDAEGYVGVRATIDLVGRS